MIRFATLLTAVLFVSSSFAAGEQSPLATAPNGKAIIACYAKTVSGANVKETIVVRNSPFVANLARVMGDEHQLGKVFLYTGHRSQNDLGVLNSRLSAEGTTKLADAAGEEWTHGAPVGTFLTARGNFKGFFLASSGFSEVGAFGMVAQGLSKERPLQLECTDSESVSEGWLKSVFSYLPF